MKFNPATGQWEQESTNRPPSSVGAQPIIPTQPLPITPIDFSNIQASIPETPLPPPSPTPTLGDKLKAAAGSIFEPTTLRAKTVPVSMPAPVPAQTTQMPTTTEAPRETILKNISVPTGTRSTTSYQTQTAGEKQALKDRAELDKADIELATKKGLIDIEKRKLEEEQAAKAAERATQLETAKNDIITKKQAESDAAIAEAKSQFENYKNMEIKDYWADRSTGAKIAAAIALGMGAFGSALTGKGGNSAADILNAAIDRDFNIQRANIEKQKGVVETSFKNVDETNKWYNLSLANVDLKEAAAKEKVATEIEARKRKLGVPEQEIANDATINALKQSAKDKQIQVEQSLRKNNQFETQNAIAQVQVDAATGKPIGQASGAEAGKTQEGKLMNENQAKAQSFMKSAERAEKTLSSLKEPEDNKIAWFNRQQSMKSIPVVGGAAQYISELVGETESAGPTFDRFTPEEQKYIASQREWISSLLRKESGAVISPQEFKEASNTYFAQPGDSEEVKRSKAAARRAKVAEMKVGTGNSNQKLWWENEEK